MSAPMAYAFTVTVLVRSPRKWRSASDVAERLREMILSSQSAPAGMAVVVDHVDGYTPEPGDFDLSALEKK